MKRLVLALFITALLAAPVAAQPADVTFSGEIIGAYGSDTWLSTRFHNSGSTLTKT